MALQPKLLFNGKNNFFFRNLIINRAFIIINDIVKMIKSKVDQFGFCEAHLWLAMYVCTFMTIKTHNINYWIFYDIRIAKVLNSWLTCKISINISAMKHALALLQHM